VQPTLFDQSPLARHRHSDPATSVEAATVQHPQALEAEILERFAMCPMWDGLTDDELVRTLPERYGPTVKTARSRLAKRGLLVANGDRRRSARGAWMAVYVAAHRSA